MDEVQEPISQSSDGADPMADRSAVLQMIRHSFGPSTLEDPFVTSDLATIVDTMVAGLRTPGYDGSSNDIFKMFGPTFGLSMTWKQHNLRKFLNTVYLFLAHRHRAYGVTCLGMPALLKNFPEFSSLDSTEQALLLAFHNYVTVAVNFLDPVNNAHIYLDMITRLTEGHEVKYIPRCGATAATRRRVGIIRAATERHVSSSKSVVASTDIGHTTVEPDLFSLIGDDKPVDRSISEMAEETRNIRDHYELLQLIREGSHGQVYLAIDKLSGKHCAADLRLTNNTAEIQQMVHLWEGLHHMHIIQLIDVFRDASGFYLVTELIDGDLFDSLALFGQYTETKALEIMHQLLDALAYLHDKGIAHRDLKLENIQLMNPSNNVKLAGFSNSKAGNMFTDYCGAPGYIAPEVLQMKIERSAADFYTVQADMWSCGVILFALLSGRMPWVQLDMNSTLHDVKSTMKDKSWVTVSATAKHLIKALLEPDPSRRLSARDALTHPWFADRSIVNMVPVRHPLFGHDLTDNSAAAVVNIDIDKSGCTVSTAKPSIKALLEPHLGRNAHGALTQPMHAYYNDVKMIATAPTTEPNNYTSHNSKGLDEAPVQKPKYGRDATDSDMAAVITMAEYSFADLISGNAFIKSNLCEIILVLQKYLLRESLSSEMDVCELIGAHFGIEISRLGEDDVFVKFLHSAVSLLASRKNDESLENQRPIDQHADSTLLPFVWNNVTDGMQSSVNAQLGIDMAAVIAMAEYSFADLISCDAFIESNLCEIILVLQKYLLRESLSSEMDVCELIGAHFGIEISRLEKDDAFGQFFDAILVLMALQMDSRTDLLLTPLALLEAYPEFWSVDSIPEREQLLKFRNGIVVAVSLFPEHKKDYIIDLVSRVVGGSNDQASSSNRMLIYLKESTLPLKESIINEYRWNNDLAAIVDMTDELFRSSVYDDFVKLNLPRIVNVMMNHLMSDVPPVNLDICRVMKSQFGVKMIRRRQEQLTISIDAVYLHLAFRNNADVYRAAIINLQSLKNIYPKLALLHVSDCERVLTFRNYLYVAINFIDPRNEDYLWNLLSFILIPPVSYRVMPAVDLHQFYLQEIRTAINPRKRRGKHQSISESHSSELDFLSDAPLGMRKIGFACDNTNDIAVINDKIEVMWNALDNGVTHGGDIGFFMHIVKMKVCKDVKPHCERGLIPLHADCKITMCYQLHCKSFPHFPIFLKISAAASHKLVAFFEAQGIETGPYAITVTVFPHYFPPSERCVTPTIFFEPSGIKFGRHIEDGVSMKLPLYISGCIRDIKDQTISVYKTINNFRCNAYDMSGPVYSSFNWIDWEVYPAEYLHKYSKPFAGHLLMLAGEFVSSGYININACHFTGFVAAAKNDSDVPMNKTWIAFCGMRKDEIKTQFPNVYRVFYGYCNELFWTDDLFKAFFLCRHKFTSPLGSTPDCKFVFSKHLDIILPASMHPNWCDLPTDNSDELAFVNHTCSDVTINTRSCCRWLRNDREKQLDFAIEDQTAIASTENNKTLGIIVNQEACVVDPLLTPVEKLDQHSYLPVYPSSPVGQSYGIVGDPCSCVPLILNNEFSVPNSTDLNPPVLDKAPVEAIFTSISWHKYQIIKGAIGSSALEVRLVENQTTKQIYALKLLRKGSSWNRELGILSYIEEIIKDSKIPMQRRFLTFYGKLEDKAVLGTDMYNIDCAFVSEWGNCGSLRTYYYKSSFCGESNADLTVSTFLHGNALAVLILLFEVLDGISWLHVHGICHLDIKPDNIVLHTQRSKGLNGDRCHLMAKIVDFGTAARISDDHGPYTLNWLRCQTQTPGTNGYSVGFNEYHKYFCKQSVEALTDIHKIFLRHMDLFSFSAVIEECSRHFLENHHIMTTQGSNEVDVNYILTYVTKELRTLCRVLRNRDHVEEDHVGVFRATVTSANDLIRDNGLPLFFLSDTRTSLDIFCNV